MVNGVNLSPAIEHPERPTPEGEERKEVVQDAGTRVAFKSMMGWTRSPIGRARTRTQQRDRKFWKPARTLPNRMGV